MKAIFKKELRGYFYSPIGFVFLAIFFFVASLFFAMYNIFGGYGDINAVFSNMTMIFLFLTPVITMRSMAEEKNSKTDQLLLTSPVKISSIVLGKLFATMSVLAIAMAMTFVYPILLLNFTTPAWGKFIGNYIGFFLMGSAFLSIGIYISALTENQIIAAVSTFGVLFLLYLADWFAPMINVGFLSAMLKGISMTTKFYDFSMGIINIGSVVYYISIVVVFVSLTVIHIEKRRWSK